MRILLDEDIPRHLKNYLPGHSAIHVLDLGWGGVQDSVFPKIAGDEWDVFVTADKNLRFQQNLKKWKIGVIVMPTNHVTGILLYLEPLLIALSHVQRGDYIEIPFRK